MGCGASKNKVQSGLTPRPPPGKKPPTARRGVRRQNSKIQVKPQTNKEECTNSDIEGDDIEIPPANHKKSKRRGSEDSLGSVITGDGRGFSASSKFSRHSGDSGFGGGVDGCELDSNIITEESNPELIAEIEAGFQEPQGLDMMVIGNPVPQRYSAKDKERMDEQRVLASLREEGLIQRPMSRAGHGMSFEIVAQNSAQRGMFGPKRPARLEKLESRRKKKRTSEMTQEEIEAKLEKAERRRKEAEQKRLAKIASLNKSDVLSALDSFANSQKEKEEQVESKLDQASENREKRLQALRDKQRAKQEHAEAVRQRKKLAPIVHGDSPRIGTPVPKITEDTPVGGAAKSSEISHSLSFDDRPVGLA